MITRIKVIDGLRGLSVLLVVLFHYTFVYVQKYAYEGELPIAVPWGGVGVSIFFVVSGLVIMKSLESATPRRFIISRVSRLYPAYFFSVLLTSAAILSFGSWYGTISLGQFLANLTLFQYYLGFSDIDGVYWSLRVEIAFYLIFALMFFSLRGPVFWVALLTYTLMAFVTNLVITRVEVPEHLMILPKVLVFHFIHYFVIGIVSYKLLFDNARKDHPRWLTAIFGLLLALAFADLLLNKALYKFASIVGVTCLLYVASSRTDGIVSHVMNCAPLQYFGRISYSLYLLHQVIGYLLIRVLQSVGLSLEYAVILAVGIVLLMTDIVHRFVEVALSNRLRRWLTERFSVKASVVPKSPTQ